MANKRNIIRTGLLLAALILTTLGLGYQKLVFATEAKINIEVCRAENAEPNLSLNYANPSVTFVSPLTLNFSADWVHSLKTLRADFQLAQSQPNFAANQTFSQTIDLIPGLNNLTFVINGGCPRHNVEQNLHFDYQPLGMSVNALTTSSNSPQLSGKLGLNNHKIKVTINGKTYDAINHGDGAWTLPAGVIQPALMDGTYDVSLELFDQISGVSLNRITQTNVLTVSGSSPVITIDQLLSNKPSPTLSGTISSKTSKIKVTINGKTYDAINHGDGAWTLPAGVIQPDLVDGVYDIKVEAFHPLSNLLQASTILNNALMVDTKSPQLSLDQTETNSRQPKLSGKIDDPKARLKVIINGKTYDAINHGDGAWTLPAGVIQPLASGEYDLVLLAEDLAGNQTRKQIVFKVAAANEPGFVLPPHTGYLRINRINIPSWLIYLILMVLIYWFIARRRKKESDKNVLSNY